MDMACMCDMRIGGKSARFSEAYLKVGLVPGAGGCYFLSRVVGLPKALEVADYGYIMESGRIVMDGKATDLASNEDVKEFYLGVGAGERKNFKDTKSYKRRKRWLA